MEELYDCTVGADVDLLFHAQRGAKIRPILKQLEAGQALTERLYPLKNHMGIASVDVMLQRDDTEGSKVWLYTLEHPKVQEKVRRSSRSELNMLRVLLDNTLEYIYFRDISGHFILSNKAFHDAVSDGNKIPLADNTIADFVSEESAAWFAELDRELLESGRAIVNEVNNVALNSGLEHWLQLSIMPVRDGDGEMIGTLSVSRDISDLKRTEEDLRHAIVQARAASRAKGEFLAAMSHEIRTPINGIIGASELCEETNLDPEQRGYMETVLQCGTTLLSLVSDVLDFSKIEAGQLNLEQLNFVPRSLLENVAESFSQQTRKKGIELITAYDEELPQYLMGDPTRLKQILNNLVSNAVKFTDEGEVVMRAETVEITDSYARVRFIISDTGIGISEHRQAAIFESFTQEDMSTTRKYGGTGLGLSISRELVELMGGRIGLDSKHGTGSVFTVELTFKRSSYHGAEAVPFNPELAGMRVLIVDDNKTNRAIYSQMCAGWGYRHATAGDGKTAIEMLEKAVEEGDRFELVILDQQMPGLSGLDVASLILSRSEFESSRLILLSSSIDREEAERAKKIGISRALSKPVKRNTLLEVILETFELGYVGGKLSESEYTVEAPMPSLEVLLVEDNPVNQIVAKQRLAKMGHEVTLAEDSLYALEAVRKKHFDCILMDIQMPGKDGYETTADIRKFEKESGQAPHYIVAMTAHAMKGDKQACLSAGMDNYISKPFRPQHLHEVLLLAADHSKSSSQSDADFGFASYLNSLTGDDYEDLEDVVSVFLENLPKDIANLQQALKEKNYKQIYFHAHSLKGAVGIFGMDEVANLARALEQASRDEADEDLRRMGPDLIHALHLLSKEMVDAVNTDEA